MAGNRGYKDTIVPQAGDDAHPFGMPWLDSCYQETLLPDAPWHVIARQIIDRLIDRIQKQNLYPERRQILFELLGREFMDELNKKNNEGGAVGVDGEKPEEVISDPSVIMPPNMSAEERRKLQLTAQKWLKDTVQQIVVELNLPQVDNKPDELNWFTKHLTRNGPEYGEKMQKFITRSHNSIKKGIDRHLLIQEREVQRRWEDLQQPAQNAKESQQTVRDRERESQRIQKERERLYGPSGATYGASRAAEKGPRSILKKNMSRLDSGLSTAMSARVTTANVKGALFGSSSDPPVFWGMQSNSLGRSLIALLKRDPRRFTQVVATLRGRQLPGALQQYIWLDIMYYKERKKDGASQVDVESLVRQSFAAAVSKGQTDLKIKKPTHSPIASLIETNVIETFKDTPAMFQYREDTEFLRTTAKTLNIVYVYNRVYEPYLVYWIYPLQLAFHKLDPPAEHPYDLALYYDLMARHLIPKWPRIFAVAQEVLKELQKADPRLHAHLHAVAQKSPSVDPKDFMVNLIQLEQELATEAKTPDIRFNNKEYLQDSSARALLTTPLIFIRKWIGEAFVGALDTQAAMFVWDQCFMYQWREDVLKDVCLVLLLLLSHNFMAASDYASMKQVFFDEPSLLYTLDIQRGFQFLRAFREQYQDHPVNYKEIPPMNRRRPKDIPPPPTPQTPARSAPSSQAASLPPTPATRASPVSQRPITAASEAPVKMLDPVGVKRVKVTLEVPESSVQKVSWLAHLTATKLRLKFSLMFGSLEVQVKDMPVRPVVTRDTDPVGTLIYKLDYRYNKVLFDDIDIGNFDLELEMGGYPHAVVEVLYTPDQGDPVALGWSRIKLYQRTDPGDPDTTINQTQWAIMTGDCTYAVYSGPSLERFGDNKTPKFTKPDTISIAQSYISLRSLDSTYLTQFGDLLGTNSVIGALVFDPRREPPEPTTPAPAPQPAPPPAKGKKKK